MSIMTMFDEAEYESRINEFIAENRIKEAESYWAMELEYRRHAEKTLTALDGAILRLDRLSLELSKLGEDDAEKAIEIIQDLETAIQDTQLYK